MIYNHNEKSRFSEFEQFSIYRSRERTNAQMTDQGITL